MDRPIFNEKNYPLMQELKKLWRLSGCFPNRPRIPPYSPKSPFMTNFTIHEIELKSRELGGGFIKISKGIDFLSPCFHVWMSQDNCYK